MGMKRLIRLCAAALMAAAPLSGLCATPAPDDGAPRGDVAHGRKLFFDTGCYQCHGVEGATGGPGGRLAPDPLPFDAVLGQLRRPVARMPIYTAQVMSDQDVADIYAYLKGQPQPRPVAEIPLLNH
jgi:mono/diheme cytochrome c family protein